MQQLKSVFSLILLLSMAWKVPLAHALPTNKQLTIGITQEYDSLNPLISQNSGGFYIYYLFTHGLTEINSDWQWQCWLCTKLPTIDNGLAKAIEEDGKKKLLVQWEIHPKATWGDGTPVTAYDMKLAWEVGKSKNVIVGLKDVFEQIESFTIDPKNPKRFTTKYHKVRYDYYQIGTFHLLPSHIEGPIWEKSKNSLGAYEKQTAYSTNPTNPGLSMGPYMVREAKAGSHVILVRNPHYYGRKPKIEKLIFKIIPNTQALEANLLAGTIDMISEIGIKFDQALALEKRIEKDPELKKRFRVSYRQGTIFEHIDFNLRNPVLQDRRVRRALTYSIDRNKLVEALFEGKQQAASHRTHPLDPYFTDEVTKYPYDPRKAAELLDAAGWKVGKNGVRERDGKPLLLSFMSTAGDKTRELVEVFLQHEWQKVGVDIAIKNQPSRTFFGETIRKAKYPAMAMYAHISSPGNVPESILQSISIPRKENGFSGQNVMGFVNKKVDAAFDDIVLELDFNKRKKLMKIVQQEVTKELPTIPLYFRAQIAVVPVNLTGFRITGHQFFSTLSADKWALK